MSLAFTLQFCQPPGAISQENEGSIYGTKLVHQPLHKENRKRTVLLFSQVANSSYPQLPKNINLSSWQLLFPEVEMADGGTNEVTVENRMWCVLCLCCWTLRKMEGNLVVCLHFNEQFVILGNTLLGLGNIKISYNC